MRPVIGALGTPETFLCGVFGRLKQTWMAYFQGTIAESPSLYDPLAMSKQAHEFWAALLLRC
jgi:hypothetical protein